MKLPAQYNDLLKEDGPKMLLLALSLYGITETKGKINNRVIMNMARETGLSKVYTNDDIAWCALFLRYLAKMAGKTYKETNLMARSWLKWGTKVEIPELGDVLVFWRTSRTGSLGHAGLYVGEDSTHYHVLGGNQSDMVNITRIPKSRLLQARRQYNVKPTNVRRIFRAAKGSVSAKET